MFSESGLPALTSSRKPAQPQFCSSTDRPGGSRALGARVRTRPNAYVDNLRVLREEPGRRRADDFQNLEPYFRKKGMLTARRSLKTFSSATLVGLPRCIRRLLALADEEHQRPEILGTCPWPGESVIKALEPDEDVGILLRHRARLPNHSGRLATQFRWGGCFHPWQV